MRTEPAGGQNAMLQVWRIVFALVIFGHHTQLLLWGTDAPLLRSGFLGVEFFFLLAGLLMAASASEKPCVPAEELGTETWRFLGPKLRRLLPVMLFAFVMELGVGALLPGHIQPDSWMYYSSRVWDLLFVRTAGFQLDAAETAVGASCWYLSAMLLGMLLLYPLLRRYTNVFLHILAPLGAALLYGYFSGVQGRLKFQVDVTEQGLCLGLLRGVAGLCVGCCAYMLARWLYRRCAGAGTAVRLLLTGCELGAFAAALVIMRRCGDSQTDFLVILLLLAGLTVTYSRCSFTAVLSQRCALRWAGDVTLAFYLNHVVWVRALSLWHIPRPFGWQCAAALGLSVLSTAACLSTLRLIGAARKRGNRA